MPLVIVLEPDGKVKLVDLAREDYEQPEMRSVFWGVWGLVVCPPVHACVFRRRLGGRRPGIWPIGRGRG